MGKGDCPVWQAAVNHALRPCRLYCTLASTYPPLPRMYALQSPNTNNEPALLVQLELLLYREEQIYLLCLYFHEGPGCRREGKGGCSVK